VIVHLIALDDWTSLSPTADWSPPSLATEGFIHCTAGDELMLVVANAFYTGAAGEFLALTIDPALVRAEVRWERPPSADPMAEVALFPHIYGPLNRDAVVGVRRFIRTADGSFTGYHPS
jgi:uncharacterized protein (DUF952 family)